MKLIVLTRIDDRLIHGQVATKWVQNAQASHIYIVDDEAAEDEFLSMVYKGLAPLRTTVEVYKEKEAVEALNAVADNKEIRGMILTKTPGVLLRMLKLGLAIDRIIVGGIGKKKNRKTIYKSISVSESEMNEFIEIMNLGVDVQCQILPSDTSFSFKRFVK